MALDYGSDGGVTGLVGQSGSKAKFLITQWAADLGAPYLRTNGRGDLGHDSGKLLDQGGIVSCFGRLIPADASVPSPSDFNDTSGTITLIVHTPDGSGGTGTLEWGPWACRIERLRPRRTTSAAGDCEIQATIRVEALVSVTWPKA